MGRPGDEAIIYTFLTKYIQAPQLGLILQHKAACMHINYMYLIIIIAYFRWGAEAEPSGSTGISIHSKSSNSSRIIRHQSSLNEHSPKLWHVILAMQAHCSEDQEKKQCFNTVLICIMVQHMACYLHVCTILNVYKLHLSLQTTG